MKKYHRSSNKASSPEIKLKVAEARYGDLGRRRARIDPIYMQKLGIEAGDVIELEGKRETAATAWPADEEEKPLDIMRLDG